MIGGYRYRWFVSSLIREIAVQVKNTPEDAPTTPVPTASKAGVNDTSTAPPEFLM
jgi:hypothetical protein